MVRPTNRYGTGLADLDAGSVRNRDGRRATAAAHSAADRCGMMA
jgi:hypothetical protein